MNKLEVMTASGIRPAGLDHRPLDFGLACETLACMVGPNETGKSAWLRALAGIEAPAAGELQLLGRPVWDMDGPSWRRMRTRAAFLAPETPLLSVADGLANVILPAVYHGIAEEAVLEERARQLLERLGWEGDLHSLPAYLDAHSRQLLALARCLLLGPEIIFMDEPFGLMDRASRLAMEDRIAGLVRDDGIALVIVTHNLEFVRKRADVILLADGAGLSIYYDWEDLAAHQQELMAQTAVLDRGGRHAGNR